MPEDKSRERKQRLEPYVPSNLLATLDLRIPESTQAEKYRKSHRLNLSARVVRSELKYAPSADDPSVLIVTVPVIRVIAGPDGSVISENRISSASKWLFVSGQWFIVSFQLGGDTE